MIDDSVGGRSIFPTPEQVPQQHRVVANERGTCYLVNGEVRRWNGPFQEVRSPVCLIGDDGPMQHRLGHHPLMDKAHALEALKAASTAYGKGCGDWASMSVKDRIRHVEAFIPRMRAAREEVIRFMMWEIGKTYADSCKEFDRTVVYIQDTIEALKDLDRGASRFVIEQGFVAQVRRSPLGVVLCMGPFTIPSTRPSPRLFLRCSWATR